MAAFLAKEGHEVRVITAFPHYPEWRFAEGVRHSVQRTREDGVPVERRRHRLPRPGSSISRVWSELSFGIAALRARWHEPEVVVLVSPAMFSNVLLVPRLRLAGRPFVIWVQDLYGLGVQETRGGGLLGRLVGRIEGRALRKADGIIAIHEQMADSVASLGVPRDRIAVVRNWSHVDEGRDDDRARTRQELGWSPEETVVLHTGNMGVKQDLQNVVEAARRADSSDVPVRFVLVGEGAERAAIERSSVGVERLEVRPPLNSDEYRRMLQAADVLLVNEHPGMRGMALPSKLTSYFTSGTPVLAATSEDSATASELRRSGAGVRVDPGDPDGLLRAVQSLASDPDTIRSVTDAANVYRRDVLGAATAGREFETVLSRVVDGRMAGPTRGEASAPFAATALAAATHRGSGRQRH